LAGITPEAQYAQFGNAGLQLAEALRGGIGGAVIHHHYFKRPPHAAQDVRHFADHIGDAGLLVVGRQQNGQLRCGGHISGHCY